MSSNLGRQKILPRGAQKKRQSSGTTSQPLVGYDEGKGNKQMTVVNGHPGPRVMLVSGRLKTSEQHPLGVYE